MKPVVTWILLANTRQVSVMVNRGPGKGLAQLNGKSLTSQEADLPRDKAGVSHSIGGPGVSAVEQADPQHKIDAAFAKSVAQWLSKERAAKEFDRLIVVAGPHMLGLLRAALSSDVQAVLIAEIAKDLSGQSVEAVTSHIDDFIAA